MNQQGTLVLPPRGATRSQLGQWLEPGAGNESAAGEME